MNTEITDRKGLGGASWVCFDADCPVCVGWANKLAGVFQRKGFVFVPLQSSEVRDRLRLTDPELLREMRIITPTGAVFGGADAVLHLAGQLPAGVVLVQLARLPGVKRLLRGLYSVVARNRGCNAGRCPVKHDHYQASNAVFAFLVGIYVWAALKGGA